jgi:hypothetical protein
MAQNQNIGLLGQYLTVNSAANTSTFASAVVVGNSTVNVAINSSSVSISGTPIGTGSGTVTSVGSGNGLTGGPITASGSLSILANSGIVANSTGTFVNAAYINTISANNAAYLGTIAAASYVINTDSRTLSGNLNFTGANTYFSNKTTYNANIVINAGVSIIDSTGSQGASNQVLTSNGTGNVYWSSITATVNVAAQYAWTNTQTFSNTITFSGPLVIANTIAANGASNTGTSGWVLTSGGTGANVYWAAASSSGQYTPRVSSTASASSVTPTTASYDLYVFTALAATLTINASTFLPTNGTKLMFRIKDNGTAQTLTWTTTGSGSFRILGTTLPTTTTVNKVTYIGCVYNSDESYWDVIAVGTQA